KHAVQRRWTLPPRTIFPCLALLQKRATIVHRGLSSSIPTFEEAQHFNRMAGNDPVAVNFKVDTGMRRMRVPENEALELFKKVSSLRQIQIQSVSTHLPVSNEDAEYTRDQLARFGKIVRQFRDGVPGDYKVHVLQSAGTLAFNQEIFDMVRAGIMLYGISPLPEFQQLFKPVMTWKTRIGLIGDMRKGRSIRYGRTFIAPRKMRIATLTCGYADGYPRGL